MIVSDKYKYLFIEVPVTGTTSISKALRENYAGRAINIPLGGKHANYSYWWSIATPEQRDYFVFASVRNPLETIVSEYVKKKVDQGNEYTSPESRVEGGGWLHGIQAEQVDDIREHGMDFPTFLTKYFTKTFNNWMLMGFPYFSYVMRYENLNADFMKVLEKLGIEPVAELPQANVTATKSETALDDYYTPEVRQHAADVFGTFMQQWGYEFPEHWDIKQPGAWPRTKFKAKNHVVNFLSRRMHLSQYNPTLARIRRWLG